MKEWSILPQAWRAMPIDDRANIMAFELFTNTREAYRQEWKEEQRKKKDKGSNPYQTMKRQMGLD